MSRKFQVFVSSTFKDLVDERQVVVEAILDSGNIPAGMELFKSSNESQWETIKKWILASDIYMLILGARYGTLEPNSGKSYTQLEYEFAIDNNIPLFTIVLKDNMLELVDGDERSNIKYINFKEKVLSKTCTFADSISELKYKTSIHINDCIKNYKLNGWVSGELMNECIGMKQRYNMLTKKYNELAQSYNIVITELKERLNPIILDASRVRPIKVKSIEEIRKESFFMNMKLTKPLKEED